MSKLAPYLTRKAQALSDRRADWTAEPARSTIAISATSTLAGNTGARPTRMGEHRIISDSAPGLAGHALGPTAPEMLLGSLASCLLHTYVIQACLLDIPLDALEVDVEATLDMAPVVGLPGEPPLLQNMVYRARVESPAGDDAVARLHEAVDATCPVLNTVRSPINITRRD
jgi:uncharacterized OsmC-like protein